MLTADKKLKSYIDRIVRLKEERDTLADDIREIYADAKAEGFDKTAMGGVITRLRKIAKSGEAAVSDQESALDLYFEAYNRASGTDIAIAHTHADETPPHDPVTGEIHEHDTGADGTANRAADHSDGVQQCADIDDASRSDANAGGDDVIVHKHINILGNSPTGSEGKIPAQNFESVGKASPADLPPLVAHGSDESAAQPAEPSSQYRQAAPEGVSPAPSGEQSPHKLTAEQIIAARPNCLNPNCCAGYGRNHCHSCAKVTAEREVAA